MCWTQYSTAGSISTQSSQEECPEAMVDLNGAELARNHALLTLEKTIDTKTVKPAYRCAGIDSLMLGRNNACHTVVQTAYTE